MTRFQCCFLQLSVYGSHYHLERYHSFRLLRFSSALLQDNPHTYSQGKVLSQESSAYFCLLKQQTYYTSILYYTKYQYQIFNKCFLLTKYLNLNLNCSSTVLRSVRMVMYFPTAFSIIAHCWQLNSDHDVNFLARFLGLVACMPITSLEPHVHNDG